MPVLTQNVGFARHGRLLTFHWRMVTQSGVKGFQLFARRHALTRTIKTHHSPAYHATVRWSHGGPFYLKVLTRYGKPYLIHISR